MHLDPDMAYRAVEARDARFDGHMFVGVTSTGVYCRPICRVRTPLRRNCRFFATAAQAEAAAFRPCLKCRPEIAPGPGLAWTVMDASRTLATQAAQALEQQVAYGQASSVAAMARQLGVTDRHLRRIFMSVHGVTPLQFMQTRRLLLAKQLLTDTGLPVAQVALASGFRSLRRFNAAFADSYRMSPSRLRGTGAPAAARAAPDATAVSLTLCYRAPCDHAALLSFLARRAIPGVEQVHADSVRRSVRSGVLSQAPGWIEASFHPTDNCVRVRFALAWAPASARVVDSVRRWLDLDAAPQVIAAALTDLPGAAGLRLPGTLDAFELAVRAVLGQQVTVAAARTLARRLVERFGTPIDAPWSDITRAFPAPATLAQLDPARIAELGIIRTRSAAIVALAQTWPRLEPMLAGRSSPAAAIEALCALPGIGPWTAHYVAMRALGWPDAFPPGDVAVRKAMQRQFGTPNHRAVEQRSQAWRPWRAYAVLRLWNSLEASP
jgi:AraC family transcriptional regulator of adaptative response / DNA-3-methyladenine glycosylase II